MELAMDALQPGTGNIIQLPESGIGCLILMLVLMTIVSLSELTSGTKAVL